LPHQAGAVAAALPALTDVERRQSVGEEIANSVSHGAGFAALVVAGPMLIVHAERVGTIAFVAGVGIFVVSAVALYLASTLYHALPHGKGKRVFRIIEHSAIFLLIAGTYTPFMLGALHGPWGWTLVALVWSLAVFGVLLKTVGRQGASRLSTALYLGMGWLLVVAVRPMWLHVPIPGLELILAGGLSYTIGTAFFAADRIRYAHFIWHLFVMGGTTCHMMAIWRYAA
jgi:hemolysin III